MVEKADLYWPNLPPFNDRDDLLRHERGKHWRTIARAARNVADAKTNLSSLTRFLGVVQTWRARAIANAEETLAEAQERFDIAEYESRIIPQEIVPFAIEIQCTIRQGVICRERANPGEWVRDHYRQGDTFTIMGVDVNDPGFYVARPSWRNLIEPVILLDRNMKVRIEHTVVSDHEKQRIDMAMERLGVPRPMGRF
jgi:hypothetical protein